MFMTDSMVSWFGDEEGSSPKSAACSQQDRVWDHFRAVGGEAEDLSGYAFSQLELLEHGRAQVLEQCARRIQGSWRRHWHRKQERQRRAAVLIQAGRKRTGSVPGQRTGLHADPA